MVDLARLMDFTTLEEVQASMMSGLLWVTQVGVGKTCIPSSSRYGHSPIRFASSWANDIYFRHWRYDAILCGKSFMPDAVHALDHFQT